MPAPCWGEHSRKQGQGALAELPGMQGKCRGWGASLQAQRTRSSTHFGALVTVLCTLHIFTHLIPTTARGEWNYMHYLIILALFLPLWLGAHMELNLLELNVVCFPCAAVLKGQSTWRSWERRLEGAQGQTQNLPPVPPKRGLNPTPPEHRAHSTEPAEHELESADADGGDQTRGGRGWGG